MKRFEMRPLALAIGAVMLLYAIAGDSAPGPAAAHAEPHPAHIHAGDCGSPGGIIAPLSDLGYDGENTVVAWSESGVALTLDALLAEPHAIVVHESAGNIGEYLLCGDISGAPVDGVLTVQLNELNDSGRTGAAILQSDQGQLSVHAFLVPSAAGGGGQVAVTIERFVYRPNPLEIAVGTTVTWTNNDGASHTVTADNGAFDSGQMTRGDSFSVTFTEPGSYAYVCNYHANMTAKVIVTE